MQLLGRWPPSLPSIFAPLALPLAKIFSTVKVFRFRSASQSTHSDIPLASLKVKAYRMKNHAVPLHTPANISCTAGGQQAYQSSRFACTALLLLDAAIGPLGIAPMGVHLIFFVVTYSSAQAQWCRERESGKRKDDIIRI